MPEPRPFPLPWTVHGNDSACWVESADGRRFAYCYFDESDSIGVDRAVRLTRDEARRIARNIARLPGLLGKG